MRAVVAREQGGKLEVEELDLAGPGPGEVRVRLRASGVCHSDLSIWDGTLGGSFPVVLGHEGAGEITELGEGVAGLSVGDHVILSWIPPCGRCRYCWSGQANLCTTVRERQVGRGHLSSGGVPVAAGLGTATFAEETVVPTEAAIPIPADVPYAVAALVGCGVMTGVGAVVNTARVRPGESVVVIGCGGVGLNVVQGARLAGADPICAIDPLPAKREAARGFGATHVAAPEDLAEVARELTEGRGFDYAFEVVGRSSTIRLAYDGKASTLIHPPHGELPSDWPKDLQLSPDGWGLLFADAVVLVEGETELGALPRWFDKITEAADTLAWSARNIAMFSVGGHYGFESWGRYLSHYHVPWAIVCDGVILDPYQPLNSNPVRRKATAQDETTPVTWQKTSAWVLLQVARARGNEQLCDETKRLYAEPADDGTRPQGLTFDEVTSWGETQGVFTLANWFAKRGKLPQPPDGTSPVESIDDLIGQNETLRKAIASVREELGERRSKVRIGLYVAEACPPPQPVHDLFGKLLNWFA